MALVIAQDFKKKQTEKGHGVEMIQGKEQDVKTDQNKTTLVIA